MKKKNTIGLLLLIAALTGCTPVESTSSSGVSESVSESIGGESLPVSDNTSAVPPISETVDTAVPDSEESNTSGGTSEVKPPLDTSQEHYTEMWGDENAALMLLHLDYVIPYIDIGRPDVLFTGKGDDWYLEIMGSKNLSNYSADEWASIFTEYYEADGFTVDTTAAISTGYVATREDKHLTVTLTVDDIVIIKCVYDEPYDSSAASSWNDEVNNSFAQYTDSHAIPYIYLGTKNPIVISGTTTSYTYRIFGGKYDSRAEEGARQALTADGYTITDVTNSNTLIFTAKKTFEDNCVLTINFAYSSLNTETRRASLQVKLTTSYDIDESNGEYDQTSRDLMTSVWGRVAPYIYLGSNTLTSSSKDSAKKNLTFKGGDWDDSCLNFILPQLEENAPEFTWTSEITSTTKGTFTGVSDTEGTFTIVVSNSSKKINAEFTYYGAYKKDEGPYAQEILDYFTSHLGGHNLPYISLGSAYYVTASEASSSSLYNGLTITSINAYSSQFLSDALQAFKDDTTAWTIDTFDMNYSEKFVATAAFDDGSEMTVTVKNYTTYDRLQIEVDYLPTYDAIKSNSTESAWPSKVQTNMKNTFGNHVLPYIYLNKTGATATASNGQVKITGGKYREEILADFTEIYENAGFTVTDTSTASTKSRRAEIVYSDNYNVIVELSAKFSSTSVPNVTYLAYLGYDALPQSEWASADKSKMTTNLHEELPYIFLGKAGTISPSYNSTTKQLEFKGGMWSEDVITHAEEVLNAQVDAENDKLYTVTRKKVSTYNTLQAVKKNTDGSELRLIIYPKSSVTYMWAFYEAAVTAQEVSWGADIAQAMTESVGTVLPGLYLGTSANFEVSTADTNGLIIAFDANSKTSFNNLYLEKADEVLTAAGYTSEYSPFLDYNTTYLYSGMVKASKTLEDGSVISLRIAKSAASKGQIIISRTPAYVDDSQTASWSEEVTAMMNKHLNNNAIPYFTLGDQTAFTLEEDEEIGHFTLSGNVWHDEYLTSAKQVLSQNGFIAGMDYTANDGTLIASKEDASNLGHYITIKLYKKANSFLTGYPVVEFYYN